MTKEILPPELLAYIFSYLDVASLKATSLASYAFMAPSRFLLFSTISIPYNRLGMFFKDVVGCKYCSLEKVLRVVVISGSKESRRADIMEAECKLWPVIRKNLRNAWTLQLRGFSISNDFSDTFWSLLWLLPSTLISLELHSMSFGTSPIPFLFWMARGNCASNVPSKIKTTLTDGALPFPLRNLSPRRLRIKLLDIAKMSPPALECFRLCEHEFEGMIEALALDLTENTQALQTFINVMGPSVQGIRITLPPALELYPLSTPISFHPFFSYNSALRSIVITSSLHTTFVSGTDAFSTILDNILAFPLVTEPAFAYCCPTNIDRLNLVMLMTHSHSENYNICTLSWGAFPQKVYALQLAANIREQENLISNRQAFVFKLEIHGLPASLHDGVRDTLFKVFKDLGCSFDLCVV